MSVARAAPPEWLVLTGHDAITVPGATVPLRVKVEDAFGPFRPDAAREKVTFLAFGRELGTARTDREGFAALTVQAPREPGVYGVTTRLDGRDGRPSGHAKLFVVPADRPVVVCDVDGTLSAMGTVRALVAGDRAPCYPGSPELLRELAKTHQVVYLTARDDALDKKTRAFLALHAFPTGPVIFDEWGLTTPEARAQLLPSNHGKFKRAVIDGLLARGLRVTLGIGNAETDAEAYEGAKIQSCIRTERRGDGPSFRFRDYAQLRARLVADGVLSER